MQSAYAFLLRLYPAPYRAKFGAEMVQVFREAAAERRAAGWSCFLAFATSELLGLLRGIGAEWTAHIGTPEGSLVLVAGLPKEIAEAHRLVDRNVSLMVHAIANHQFEKARFYSALDIKARENLRRLSEREKINGASEGIPD